MLLASVGCMEGVFSFRAFHLDGWAGQDIRRLVPRQSPVENGLVRGVGEARLHSSSLVPKENGGSTSTLFSFTNSLTVLGLVSFFPSPSYGETRLSRCVGSVLSLVNIRLLTGVFSVRMI